MNILFRKYVNFEQYSGKIVDSQRNDDIIGISNNFCSLKCTVPLKTCMLLLE